MALALVPLLWNGDGDSTYPTDLEYVQHSVTRGVLSFFLPSHPPAPRPILSPGAYTRHGQERGKEERGQGQC